MVPPQVADIQSRRQDCHKQKPWRRVDSDKNSTMAASLACEVFSAVLLSDLFTALMNPGVHCSKLSAVSHHTMAAIQSHYRSTKAGVWCSNVLFLLPSHFKGISKILKHKPLTFKGFHKKSLWNSKSFQRLRKFQLIKIEFEEKQHKREHLNCLISFITLQYRIHIKSWFPDTYNIMHYCTMWHTYNMVEKFVTLFSGKWWYCRYSENINFKTNLS